MSLADTAATASPLTVVDVTRHWHGRAVPGAAARVVPCRPGTGMTAAIIAAATAADRIGILIAATHHRDAQLSSKVYIRRQPSAASRLCAIVAGRAAGPTMSQPFYSPPRTRRSPRSTSSMSEAGSWLVSSRSDLSRVTIAVTLTTESRGRPDAAAGKNTFPGIAARAVLDVITAATTVTSRLTLNGSDWMTSTGRRLAGLLPRGSPRSAQQTLLRRTTTRPRQPDAGARPRLRPGRSPQRRRTATPRRSARSGTGS